MQKPHAVARNYVQKALRRAEQPSSVRRDPPRHARKRENLPRANLRNRYQRRIQRVIQAERMHNAVAQHHIEHHSRHRQAAQHGQRPRAHQQHLAALARRNRQHVARLVKRYVFADSALPSPARAAGRIRVKQKDAVRFRTSSKRRVPSGDGRIRFIPGPPAKSPVGTRRSASSRQTVLPQSLAQNTAHSTRRAPCAFQPDLFLRLAFRQRQTRAPRHRPRRSSAPPSPPHPLLLKPMRQSSRASQAGKTRFTSNDDCHVPFYAY